MWDGLFPERVTEECPIGLYALNRPQITLVAGGFTDIFRIFYLLAVYAEYNVSLFDSKVLEPSVIKPVSYTHLDVYKRQP